jgi:hypothetical protein
LNRRYFVLEIDIRAQEEDRYGQLVDTAWAPTLRYAGCTGFDLQAGVIRYLLDKQYPVVSIVHSGNKSLHVWCSGRGLSDVDLKGLIIPTSKYGVDVKAGKCKSQFMRLPNPTHSKRPQHLLYFNSRYVNR